MTAGISIEELLAWNDEAANDWKAQLASKPGLLELRCGIGGAETVQDLVRHIWGVELRWAQRVAQLPVTDRKDFPVGPLDALFGLHTGAAGIIRGLLEDPKLDWDEMFDLEYDWLPPHARCCSRRKLTAHGLFHSQRHWAQLATLVREAGHPVEVRGDILFSQALR